MWGQGVYLPREISSFKYPWNIWQATKTQDEGLTLHPAIPLVKKKGWRSLVVLSDSMLMIKHLRSGSMYMDMSLNHIFKKNHVASLGLSFKGVSHFKK